MKKIKILFVMHELTVGGAERVVINIMNNLNKEIFDVHLCLFKKKGDLLEMLSDSVVIHDLCVSRVSRGFFKLFFLILSLKPDIVFSGITHVNLLIAIQVNILKKILKNIKFISREVNIPSIRALYLAKSKRMDFFYKKLVHNFDRVIAQSSFMKEDLQRSYELDDKKLIIINNPIDFIAINNKLEGYDGIPLYEYPNKINILSVGRLCYQKGFDVLIEVMQYLDDNYHLNILGEGDQRIFIEKKIRELNLTKKVTLLGFSDNPYKYMLKADIFTLTSRYEGFPNVILEANACGKFVVAFACPGVSEEIIEDNVNGVLIKQNDLKELAKAVRNHATREYKKDIILQSTNNYRVSNIIKKYEQMFIDLEGREE